MKKSSKIGEAAQVIAALKQENANLRRERADTMLYLAMACLQNGNHEMRVKTQLFDISKYKFRRYNDVETGEIVIKLEEKPDEVTTPA